MKFHRNDAVLETSIDITPGAWSKPGMKEIPMFCTHGWVRALGVAFVAMTILVASATPPAWAEGGLRPNRYRALVARTSLGIPHIRARDWGSLGYGYGYVFAQDNICVLAQSVVSANAELSRFFGPADGNLERDLVWALYNSPGAVQSYWGELKADMQALVRGYAEGYNRYLEEKGIGGIAEPCQNAAWVRPIDELDLLRVINQLTLLSGVAAFVPSIAGAVPPPPPFAAAEPGQPNAPEAAAATVAKAAISSHREAERLVAQAALPPFDHEQMGSNGVALGRDFTKNGVGALMGNPHFPWLGNLRQYAVHLTIPGRYDAMGSSLTGFPLVQIGFNRELAWTHTVSTGRRFVVFELTLPNGDPTSYVVDGEVRAMTQERVSVEVLQPDGSLATLDHTFYMTEFGPMLVIPPLAGWTETTGYALKDVNVGNTRGLKQTREMGAARDLDEFVSALESNLWLPWVNTIAVSRKGEVYYGDISVIPNLTDEKLTSCATSFVAQVLSANRVYTVDGSRPECNLDSDPTAPAPGIFGPGSLPSLRRFDYVQNSNDSYWLSNPNFPLVGFPQIIGNDEDSEQGLRTRLGLTQIQDRLDGTDGIPGDGFSRRWLEEALFQNRSYSAELLLPGVRALCASDPAPVDTGSGAPPVDLSQACSVLEGWDARNDVDSVGAHVWIEFWERAAGIANLYSVPFDPSDPINTPRGLDLADPAVSEATLMALAQAVERLEAAGLPLDAEWGDVHFDTRATGEAIPMPGGLGGVYNLISAPLTDGAGYTPVVAGSSWIQFVTWRGRQPDARGLLTFSQSSDPASENFSDMTRLFSAETTIKLPYSFSEIVRDPNRRFQLLIGR